jgi:hypothetical protein
MLAVLSLLEVHAFSISPSMPAKSFDEKVAATGRIFVLVLVVAFVLPSSFEVVMFLFFFIVPNFCVTLLLPLMILLFRGSLGK